MPELLALRADHAAAVHDFERANRAYFAASVSDRGDAFFEQFADRFAALLAEQEAGVCAFHVLVAEDGTVLGRFNLYDIGAHPPALGYRVAEHAAGRGLATAAVRELCALAVDRHGVHTVRAAVSHANAASRRVLVKAGFVPVGPAGPADLGGRTGTWYEHTADPGR